MINFSKKIILFCIILSSYVTHTMRPKDMNYHLDLVLAKEYYIKNFGSSLASKLIELKKMQLNGDKAGLENRKIKLNNILEKRWYNRSELIIEVSQIDLLLKEKITDVLAIIKNAELSVAIEALYNIKDDLQNSELKTAQTILESRITKANEPIKVEQNKKNDLTKTSNTYDSKQTHDVNTKIENNSEISQGLYSQLIDLGLRFLSIFNYNTSELDIDNNEVIICCSSVAFEVLDPVVSILGEAIGLATFNTKNSLVDDLEIISNNSLSHQETSVSKEIPERIYYEKRRKELLDLKQKFDLIQFFLKDACNYKNNNILNVEFSLTNLLSHTTIKSITQPTIDVELKFDKEQKKQLQEIRQADLAQIEKSIVEIQHNIIFLFKELIEQKNESFKDLCAISSETNASALMYNNLLDRKINLDLESVIITYGKHCKVEFQLEDVKDQIDHLSYVIRSYETYKKDRDTSIIEKTTNILAIIDQEKNNIKETNILLDQAKKQIYENKDVLEEKLSKYVNVNLLRNKYRQQAQQQNQANKVHQYKKAQANRANFQLPKMPNKDDDDKDKSKDSSNNQRNTLQAHNMKEVFSKTKFGEKLQECSVKTKKIETRTNSQVYEITKDMPEFNLKKGDQFYLDKYHKDHIEVFRNNKSLTVLNIDGSVNINKQLKAINRILETK